VLERSNTLKVCSWSVEWDAWGVLLELEPEADRSHIADESTFVHRRSCRGPFQTPQHEFDEFAPLEIDTLEPERTLLEKLAALHTIESQALADPNVLGRLGTKMAARLRQSLCCSATVENDERAKALDLAAMLADIERRTVASDWNGLPAPSEGSATAGFETPLSNTKWSSKPMSKLSIL